MKKPKDCYLVIRFDEKQKTEVISPLCVGCGRHTEDGMFWPGHKGYSEYLWECSKCGELIHDGTVDG